jgi:hypothetical protein
MMKVAFVAFAGLFGLATAQTCENVEEYSVRAPTPCRRAARRQLRRTSSWASSPDARGEWTAYHMAAPRSSARQADGS